MNLSEECQKYLQNLKENEKAFLMRLFELYPVKDLWNEKFKLIQNGKKNYPNGFELCDDGMVNIFLVVE